MLERTWGHGAWANASTVPMAAGRLIAAGSAASKSRPSCGRLITVGCCTQWVLSPPPRARHAGQLVVELRCRSASLSIGYAMAIHKPMAVGGTRVVGSGMRVGRPAGGSVMAAPDGTTQERLVPRAGWWSATSATTSASPGSSPTRCCWPFAHEGTAAAVEAVYTEAVGAPSVGLEEPLGLRSCFSRRSIRLGSIGLCSTLGLLSPTGASASGCHLSGGFARHGLDLCVGGFGVSHNGVATGDVHDPRQLRARGGDEDVHAAVAGRRERWPPHI